MITTEKVSETRRCSAEDEPVQGSCRQHHRIPEFKKDQHLDSDFLWVLVFKMVILSFIYLRLQFFKIMNAVYFCTEKKKKI